jgi:TrpR-related protein YerC/YecD
MNDKLKDAPTDLLFAAVLSLKNIEECYAFFEDISTIAELKSLAQRLQVAMMLRHGRTYTEICDATGVSTATISRVNRCLEYGADGYRMVLDRLETAGLLPPGERSPRQDAKRKDD